MAIDSFSGQYRFLSNFQLCDITIVWWNFKSTEHAFQALKMTTEESFNLVRNAKTPGECKRIARSLPCREDWESVKDIIMLQCLREKFKAGSIFATLLLETGNEILIEGNIWGDTYWGVCKGVGQNKLGQLLMQVRKELRNV